MTASGFTPDSGFLGLAAIVLLLGLRHGFDADHLAAIDGLACHNATRRPRLARLSGVLFSLGHGIVVVGVALAVSLLAQAWQTPGWLDGVGVWISVSVLTLLALINIVAVVRTPGDEVAHLIGWRRGVLAGLLRAEHPATVMGVGVVFAVSFDTVSQAALFAMTAASYGGWQPALLLALLFIAGMLVTDGVNGWLIWRLMRRSERSARVASRTVALAVSGVGLLTAGMALATRFVPAVELWAEGKEIWFGAAVVAIVLASFALGQRLARPVPERAGDPAELCSVSLPGRGLGRGSGAGRSRGTKIARRATKSPPCPISLLSLNRKSPVSHARSCAAKRRP